MKSRESARSHTLALGLMLLAITLAPGLAAAQAGDDPLQKPLWKDAAEVAAVLDSVPARIMKFQMISFPLDPSPNTVSGIFDELGGYNNQVWRLGHWLPTLTGTDKYQEPNAFTTVALGLGYWHLTRDSVRVKFNGTAPTDTVELPLLQGPNGAAEWNQLGNPFPFATGVPVAGWRVVKRDSLLTLGQAASRTWIDANMRVWNPDTKQYSAIGTIPKAAGFWSKIIDPDTSLQWTKWIVQDTIGTGYWSATSLDSKGNPHITCYTGPGATGQARYMTRRGNRWINQIVDAASSGNYPGVYSNVELDSLDLPYIAYQTWFNDGSKKPFFTRMQSNGSFTIPEQIEVQAGTPQNGWGLKLKLFHGVPRVVYNDQTNGLIKYAEKTISGWTVTTVSDLGVVQSQDSDDLGFAISANGVPHIAFTSKANPKKLIYVTRVGANWTSEVVDSIPPGSTGLAPSIAVDASGVPHIAYFDATNVDLKYARKSGSTWVIETVDATGNTGNYAEILIRPNGRPAIAFLEYASMSVPTRIRYVERGASGWGIPETVDDVNVSSGFQFIGADLDAQGNPAISYQGSGAQLQMRFAEKIRGRWRIKVPPVAAEPQFVATPKPDGADWAVAITARQGDRAAEPMFLGVASKSEAIAALRSWKAPAPPDGELLSLTVPRGDDQMVRDFQSPAETVRWTIVTAGGLAPGEQTLGFEGFDLPAGLKLYLTDSESGWTREVHAGESVSLAARPRTLELVATSAPGGLPVSGRTTGLSFAYPNPFASNTGFAFTLATSADVRVDLFDVSGRRVRSIERAGASAGEHVLVWDGRDEGGRRVPSGVYLARWSAGTASGTRRLVKVE